MAEAPGWDSNKGFSQRPGGKGTRLAAQSAEKTASPSSSPSDARRPPGRGTAFYRRKRAVKACQVCRARRTKCDNLKPSCTFCLTVGATCIQSPADLSSFDPASLEILERLEKLERLLAANAASAKARHGVAPIATGHEPSPPIPAGDIAPPGPHRVVTWTVFQAIVRRDPLAADASSLVAGRTTPPIAAPSPVSVSALGDLDMVHHFLDSFFSNVHVKNPILDETVARQMVQSKALNGIDWSPDSCLSLLICALGSLASPFGPSLDIMPGTAPYACAQSFFEEAQRRLGILVSSNDLVAAQCLFLCGVYMMCTFRPAKAWRFFVQALACCQHVNFLGLGRAQTPEFNAEAVGPPEQHSIGTLQQAIYWSSWKSERELRAFLSLPDFQPSCQYPPFFPTPPALHQDPTVSSDCRLARHKDAWYFYLAEISLRRLTARISAEITSIRSQHTMHQGFLEAMANAVPEYEKQADEWIASLPACLSFDAPAQEDDVCRFVLRGHVINLFELIYWPFACAHLNAVGGDVDFPNNPGWSGYARLAQTALDYHLLRLAVNRPGYRHRHHGTILMMWTCSRSALVLAAAAVHDSSRGDGKALVLPQGWQAEIDQVIDMLVFWGNENETRQLAQVQRVLERVRAMVP